LKFDVIVNRRSEVEAKVMQKNSVLKHEYIRKATKMQLSNLISQIMHYHNQVTNSIELNEE
jgi:hypothetical protein